MLPSFVGPIRAFLQKIGAMIATQERNLLGVRTHLIGYPACGT